MKVAPLEDLMLEWFRQYGTHVIRHRAVPAIEDGLKPSQRRVLHALWEMEDGRYNKVAGIIGHTMKYHPHGDQSVFETLVGLGQKGYLIDTQGNWGNTLTGDGAAAPRYIEARLSPLAKDCLFNKKTCQWRESYDGRNKEPVTLPSKLPLLLIHGGEGIAVSLACKVLPHNLAETIEAMIAQLEEGPYNLVPDFPTGASMDTTQYNEGTPGGKLTVRAKIEREKGKKLTVTEIPYGTTTGSLRESILKADAKGQIHIKRINDQTAGTPRLEIEFPADTDMEKAEMSLYAFTDCQVTITVNPIVIEGGKPRWISTKELVAESARRTRELTKKELEIELAELADAWHKTALETLFIQKKGYLELEGAENQEEAISKISTRLRPHWGTLRREPSPEDIARLTELPMRRIAKYDISRAQKELERLEKLERSKKKALRHLTQTTIEFLEEIKRKYGHQKRQTVIARHGFEKIEVKKAGRENTKLYANLAEGLVGTDLRKETCLPFEVGDKTDVAGIGRNGTLRIMRPAPKVYYAEDLLAVWPVADERIYNMLYTNKEGKTYAKRFIVADGFIREKSYPLAGEEPARVLWLEACQENKQQKVEVRLERSCKARKKKLTVDFGSLAVKGRLAAGYQITTYPVKETVPHP
jgi:topoisomerase IV subunit A